MPVCQQTLQIKYSGAYSGYFRELVADSPDYARIVCQVADKLILDARLMNSQSCQQSVKFS